MITRIAVILFEAVIFLSMLWRSLGSILAKTAQSSGRKYGLSGVWLYRRGVGRLQYHDGQAPRPQFYMCHNQGLFGSKACFFEPTKAVISSIHLFDIVWFLCRAVGLRLGQSNDIPKSRCQKSWPAPVGGLAQRVEQHTRMAFLAMTLSLFSADSAVFYNVFR